MPSKTTFSDEWRTLAGCLGTAPSSWDIRPSTPRKVENVRAERKCADCPVRLECAIDALHHKDVGVIRAGIPIRSASSQSTYQSAESRRRLHFVIRQEQQKKESVTL